MKLLNILLALLHHVDIQHTMKLRNAIKQEMRFLTKRLRDKDEEDVVVGDWKFAAMVIDRYNKTTKQQQNNNKTTTKQQQQSNSNNNNNKNIKAKTTKQQQQNNTNKRTTTKQEQ